MKLSEINLILTVILFIFMFKIFNKLYTERFDIINELEKEPQPDSPEAIIYKAIKETYKLDMESISRLSDIAAKIQKSGGLEVPGNLTIYGNVICSKDLTVSGNSNIKGDVAINGNIAVAKASNFKDFVSIRKDLSVDGETIVTGNIFTKNEYKLFP